MRGNFLFTQFLCLRFNRSIFDVKWISNIFFYSFEFFRNCIEKNGKTELKWWWDEHEGKNWNSIYFSVLNFSWRMRKKNFPFEKSKLNMKCVNWRRSKIICCQFSLWILIVNWKNSFHTPFGPFSALNNSFKSLMATFCYIFYSRTFVNY